MAVDEAARLHLYEQARRLWDGEAADTLMQALPRDPDRFATKDDVAVLGGALRAEMADLGGALRAEMADLGGALRTEMADLRGELRADMADLRGELKADMADLRGELRTGLADLRSDMNARAAESVRTIVFSVMASNATMAALVLAAVKLA